MNDQHRSGYVNIIGKPNAGKSTLMNALLGERMSIITNKPQTTRHRILGIMDEEDYQVVFSDTPGYIDDPAYKMQENMNAFVNSSFADADLILLLIDVANEEEDIEGLFAKVAKAKVPVFLLLNKIDLIDQNKLTKWVLKWEKKYDFKRIMPLSASEGFGVDVLKQEITKELPLGPKYYPADQITDRPERFFVSEIIRESLLKQYRQEIPYSCQVEVESFKEDEEKKIIRIRALIYVMRESQKNIIIGKGGSSIKQVGIQSRKGIEQFLDSKVYLELFVKVKDNWRDNERDLKNFGYS